MAKKKKQVVWHKKRGKFMPSSVLKSHPTSSKAPDGKKEPTDEKKKKLKEFGKKLSEQIKRAAREGR